MSRFTKDWRQIGRSIDRIRDDHRVRYELAAREGTARHARSAADVGCGIGYGAWLIATTADIPVTAYDIDRAAHEYGERYYNDARLTRVVADAAELPPVPFDLVAAFEVIEHFAAAPSFLRRAADLAGVLVGSVPNQAAVPFDPARHRRHVRHYTAGELGELLSETGWRVERLGSQPGKRGTEAAIRWDDTSGRTLVFVAAPA